MTLQLPWDGAIFRGAFGTKLLPAASNFTITFFRPGAHPLALVLAKLSRKEEREWRTLGPMSDITLRNLTPPKDL